jgi:hypothetical protein
LSQDANKRLSGTMRMQANLNIGERFNGRGIIYVKLTIAQEAGILIVLVLEKG